ncbi:hypothetical protein PFISCL1PPCAC_14159, partial [Pristionchus fissidentatus]
GIRFRFILNALSSPEYNCSGRSPSEWAILYGTPQLQLGIWSIAVGTVAMILYVPTIRVFAKERCCNSIKA